MSPTLYYGIGAASGLVNWVSLTLACLSDVMPPEWRAPSFGLLLAGLSLGFSFAPLLALRLGHFHVSVFSLSLVLFGLVFLICFWPETLPPETARQARQKRLDERRNIPSKWKLLWIASRPARELSILNRSNFFRLLSTLAFFSGMVSSADRTLLVYYLEERLAFNDQDVASMFLILGVSGFFVQSILLKIFNDTLGERRVIIICFLLGSLSNFMYGMAKSKTVVFVAFCVAAFAGMAFPTISAIKSNNVVRILHQCQSLSFALPALVSHTLCRMKCTGRK